MNLGESLRKAREEKGLTTSQLAARTHILVQIIEDMEREDFHRIPAAIYGRGFVRHWAEATGVDAAPFVNAFMAIYTGHRAPNEKLPPAPPKVSAPPETPSLFNPPPPAEPAQPAAAAVPPPAEEPPAPEPVSEPPIAEPPVPEPVADSVSEPTAGPSSEPTVEPASEIPPAVRGLDLFDPQAKPAAPRGVPPPTVESPFAAAYAEEEIQGPSATEKFRQGLSVVSHGVLGQVRRIPRNTWRIALLACAALAVVTLVILGCVKLYQITERPAARPAPAAKPMPAKAAAKPVKLVSTGDKVNPLYLD